jgi:dihydroorotate dehydrogenase
MKKLIVSAPFGNYLHFRHATPTLGTYTVQNRGGFWWRVWKILTTVRYNFQEQSWVNKLGLPNPGIHSLWKKHWYYGLWTHRVPEDCILSIHGFNINEWVHLLETAKLLDVPVELNLSCPNITAVEKVHHLPIRTINGFKQTIIAKLSPVSPVEDGVALFDQGIRYFHLCNTIPCEAGGKSGKPLKKISLVAVENFRAKFGRRVTLIGGGGVTCLQDVKDYVRAGADHVAVGSMLFNPFLWPRLRTFADYLESL